VKKIVGFALVGAVLAAAIVVLVSGGSPTRLDIANRSSEDKACVIDHNGVKSQIRPENSGLRCSGIQSILMVLSNGLGVSTLYNENDEPSWVCREYPKSALPRELRCHEGRLHFERVRIQDGAGG
jgi:hypothetical protein